MNMCLFYQQKKERDACIMKLPRRQLKIITGDNTDVGWSAKQLRELTVILKQVVLVVLKANLFNQPIFLLPSATTMSRCSRHQTSACCDGSGRNRVPGTWPVGFWAFSRRRLFLRGRPDHSATGGLRTRSYPSLLLDALNLGKRHAPASAHFYAVYALLPQLSADRFWMGAEMRCEFGAEHERTQRRL